MTKSELINKLEELIKNLKAEENVTECRFDEISEATKTENGSEIIFEIGVEIVDGDYVVLEGI